MNTDQDHAGNLRQKLSDLNEAAKLARQSGLTIRFQVDEMPAPGELRLNRVKVQITREL
jgi:hypothetical protein